MRTFFPFAGDDVFISYSRRDENEVGERYAVNLYEELKKRGFSSFLDRLGTEPGSTQPESLNQKIRNSKMLIIVGTERACQSAFVEGEIKEFLKARRIPIVPIDFNGTVPKARWYPLVEGVTLELEPLETLGSGIPSNDVLARIEEAFKYTKRNEQLRKATYGTFAILIALLIAVGCASIYAGMKIKEVAIERDNANTAKQEAASERKKAESAKNDANVALELANKANEAATIATNKADFEFKRATEQTNIANTKTEEAKKATKLANEKDKLAQEKTKLAIQKTEEAKTAGDESQKAKAESKKQQEIAGKLKETNSKEESRKLALIGENQMREPNGIIRAALLANEALRLDHSVEADSVFRESLSLLPQPINVLYKGLQVKKSKFSPRGEFAAALDSINVYDGSGGKFILWETKDWRQVESFAHEGIRDFEFDPTGKYLLLLTYKAELTIYDLLTLKALWSKKVQEKGEKIYISSNGEKVAIKGGNWADGYILNFFDVIDGNSFPDFSTSQKASVDNFTFSKDSELFKITVNNKNIISKIVDGKRITEQSDLAEIYSVDLYFGCLSELHKWTKIDIENKNCEEIDIPHNEDNPGFRKLSPKGAYLLIMSGDDIIVRKGDEFSFNEEIAKISHKDLFEAVFSPDESSILTAGNDGTVRIWETDGGKEISRIPWKEIIKINEAVDARDVFESIGLSSDGKLLLINLQPESDWIEKNTQSSSFYLFNTRPFKITAYSMFPKAYNCIALSLDGNYVAFAGGHDVEQTVRVPEKSEVQILDLKTGVTVKTLRFEEINSADNDVRIESLAFSSDGRTIAVGANDGKIRLWNWTDNTQQVRKLSHSDNSINIKKLIFNSNDLFLVSFGDQSVKLWSLPDGKEVSVINQERIEFAEFNPNGNSLLTVNSGNTIVINRLPDYQEIRRFQLNTKVLDAKFSPKNNLIATASDDGYIRLWNINTGERVLEKKYEEVSQDNLSKKIINTLSFSKQGEFLAGISGKTEKNNETLSDVVIWEMSSGKLIKKITHPYKLADVSFSPDGKNIVTTGYDGKLRIWNILRGENIARISRKFESSIVGFSKDGKYIITPGERHLWRSEDFTKIADSIFIRSLNQFERDEYFLK